MRGLIPSPGCWGVDRGFCHISQVKRPNSHHDFQQDQILRGCRMCARHYDIPLYMVQRNNKETIHSQKMQWIPRAAYVASRCRASAANPSRLDGGEPLSSLAPHTVPSANCKVQLALPGTNRRCILHHLALCSTKKVVCGRSTVTPCTSLCHLVSASAKPGPYSARGNSARGPYSRSRPGGLQPTV